MEINEFYVMPLGELTVEQYITLIGFIFGLIIVGCAVASIVVDILKIILNLIHYAIRKDKYNSLLAVVLKKLLIFQLKCNTIDLPGNELQLKE